MVRGFVFAKPEQHYHLRIHAHYQKTNGPGEHAVFSFGGESAIDKPPFLSVFHPLMSTAVKSQIWTITGYVGFAVMFFAAGIVARQQYEKAKDRQRWKAPVVEQLTKPALDSIAVTIPTEAMRNGSQFYVHIYNGTNYDLRSIVLRVTGSEDGSSAAVDRLYRVLTHIGSLSSTNATLEAPELRSIKSPKVEVSSVSGIRFDPNIR